MTSKMIFCIAHPHNKDTTCVTDQVLLDLFSEFGSIKHIKIFSRRVKVKCFIEFSNSESAHNLVSRFPKGMTSSFGKIQVYLSDKEKIEFMKESSRQKSLSSNSIERELHPKNILSSEMSAPEFTLYGNQPNFGSLFKTSTLTSSYHPKEIPFDATKTLHHISKYPINSQVHDLTTESNWRNREPNIKKVLLINRVASGEITPEFLFNLFSIYGNITKILIDRDKKCAFIEYQTKFQAELAIFALKNLQYFGQSLKIKLSDYNTLNFKTLEKKHNDTVLFFYGNPKKFRYTCDQQIICLPPNKILKIENLPRDVNIALMLVFLSLFCEPEKLIVIEEPSSDKNTAIVEFDSINLAAEILSKIHDQRINDKCLKCSFYQALNHNQ